MLATVGLHLVRERGENLVPWSLAVLVLFVADHRIRNRTASSRVGQAEVAGR